MSIDRAIPDGFSRHFRKSSLTEPWEPLYSRRIEGEAVQIGLLAAAAHCNSRGFVHGGLIATLADNAMGLSCSEAMGRAGALVTVNLALDYLSSGQIGQWIQVEPQVVRAGSSLCFVQALVTADGAPCARANATFKVMAAA